MNRLLKAQFSHASKNRGSGETTFCKYNPRECMQTAVEGYDYCLRHILEDKTAPFKQCTYVTKSGRRCPIAALKQERKDGYCIEHAKKATLGRQRMNRKKKPRESADVLLEELANSNSGLSEIVSGEHRRGKSHGDSVAGRALEYASSSDSDTETLVGQVFRDDGDSDADSVDSDQEDMLKYAGVYTTEEVAQILRDKLIRLQALYLDQFKRLRHVLLSKRREYLHSYRKERETMGSVKLYKKDSGQRLKYDKLCAMKRYHKKFGKESLLQQQCTERRIKATDGGHREARVFSRCEFCDEGIQCPSKVVPLSKFCQKHILHDPAQVLYRPCPFADSQCGRPVPSLFNSDFCSLHQRIEPLQAADSAPKLEPQEQELDVTDIKAEPSVPATKSEPSETQTAADSQLYPDRQSLESSSSLQLMDLTQDYDDDDVSMHIIKVDDDGVPEEEQEAVLSPANHGQLFEQLGEEEDMAR